MRLQFELERTQTKTQYLSSKIAETQTKVLKVCQFSSLYICPNYINLRPQANRLQTAIGIKKTKPFQRTI